MDLVTLILFIVGLVVLIVGAEVLVRGASHLALSIGIPSLIVGLTIVSFGTSAPELATNIMASFAGHADIAIGNVVGSNTANILLVLGLSASLGPLVVAPQLLRFDVPIVIGLSVLVLLIGFDGIISTLDGLILFGGFIGYTGWLAYVTHKDNHRKNEKDRKQEQKSGNTSTTQPRPERKPLRLLLDVGLVAAGVAMLTIGSRWLVNGAVAIANLFGLSELVIGLTIVAVGTSLPELATSATASLRGHRDIAVGNAIGSNIFNMLLVLGLASIITPDGIAVSSEAISFDIPIMIAVAILAFPLLFTGQRVERWEGLLLFGYYLIYTVYLVLRSSQHAALPMFSTITLVIVGITFALVLLQMMRAISRKRSRLS